jgi:hypothetical protein
MLSTAKAVRTRRLLPAQLHVFGILLRARQGAQHAITLPANGWGPHGWTRSGSLCLCSGSGADSYRDLEHGARHGEVHHIFSVS